MHRILVRNNLQKYICSDNMFIHDCFQDLHGRLADGNLEDKELQKAKEGQVNMYMLLSWN